MKNNYVIHPYLDFNGRCEEALEFYRQTVGAEVVMLMHFGEAPEEVQAQMGNSANRNKVMHARVRIGDSTIMASDGRCTGKPGFQGVSLSLTVPNPAEAEKAFKALAEGGQVRMPMEKTFFSPAFGMLTDKFGVSWMVYVEGQRE